MQAAFETIAIMSQRNGRWRGEADNSPSHQDPKCVIGSAPATFMMSRTPTSPEDLLVHKQDEYVAAADFRPWAPQRTQSLFHVCFSGYLQEESIRGELSVTQPQAADTTRGSEIATDSRRERSHCDRLSRPE
jgi:hypothetical protein